MVKALAQRLARLPGVTVRETREPYTPWLREWLSDPAVQARELLVGFAHDRNLHLREVVEPALARGEVVLCDRYTYSTIAYQALHNPEALVRGLVEGVRKPDLAVVLTCPLEIAMARIVARGLPPDRYDHKRDIQAKVAAAYEACAAADDFAVMVDGSGTPEDTLEAVWRVVLERLFPLEHTVWTTLECINAEAERIARTLMQMGCTITGERRGIGGAFVGGEEGLKQGGKVPK